jgi:hypothetical protein
MRPPVTLVLDSASQYAALMWILLLVFLLRVVGQIVAATLAPAWLPPMARWYSGLMPYRYLLPTQVAFLVVMTIMTLQVGADGTTLGARRASPAVGAAIVWASYIYALGMVVRSVRYVRAPRERRGVLIPIIFHVVLAAFLFVYGSKLVVEQQQDVSPRRTPRDATASRPLDEFRGRNEDRQRPRNTQRAIRVVVPLARRMRVAATATGSDRDRRHA